MGYQVIKQPGKSELYAGYSSYTDTWQFWDATRQDVVDWFVAAAVREARRSAQQLLEALDDHPRKAYAQFAMTFEEANAASVEHGGQDLLAVRDV